MSILAKTSCQYLIKCCNDLGVDWQVNGNVLYISENMGNDDYKLNITVMILTNIPISDILEWVVYVQEQSLAETSTE